MRAKAKANAPAQLELAAVVADYRQTAARRESHKELARLLSVSCAIQDSTMRKCLQSQDLGSVQKMDKVR